MTRTKSDQESLALPGNWDITEDRLDTSSQLLLPVGTDFVEQDVLSIAERAWVEFGVRIASCACGACLGRGHFPHMVMEVTEHGETVPVFGFKQFDNRVLKRLHEIDTRRVDVGKQVRDKREAARRDRRRQFHDAQGEALDMVESALRSHKHEYKTPIGTTDPNLTQSKIIGAR